MRSEQVAQGLIQAGLENFQGRRVHNISVQPTSLLKCPHGKKSFSLYPVWIYFSFCPLLLMLPPCAAVKNLAPSPRQPPHRSWKLLLGPLGLLQVNKPSSFSLCSWGMCLSPWPPWCPSTELTLISQCLSCIGAQARNSIPAEKDADILIVLLFPTHLLSLKVPG